MSEPKHAAPRPVTFGDLFQNREYRALYSASTLSWVGDYLARAAVTALIFHTTNRSRCRPPRSPWAISPACWRARSWPRSPSDIRTARRWSRATSSGPA